MILKLLAEQFSGSIQETGSFRGDDYVIVIKESLLDICFFLRNEDLLKFEMLLDVAGADYLERFGFLEVVYHLYSLKFKKRLRLKVQLKANETIPSVCNIWKAANWFEREAYDLFGIKFADHPNLKRILTFEGFQGHALLKSYKKEMRQEIPVPDDLLDSRLRGNDNMNGNDKRYMYLNLGPSHPAMHGCFRVLLELDGEKIVNAVQEIGYLHRCFEKEAEAHTYTQVIPYTDRLNYVSPLMNNVGYCLSVEKLFDLDIPERAKWIRMLICEVSRIIDHLVSVGPNLVDVGALTNYWYLFNAREMLIDWVEALCGARLTTSYTRIGGVMRDLPINTSAKLTECIKLVRQAVKDVEGLTKKNRILIDRTQGVGSISAEDAISYGFTGPCLRAAGVAYDVRLAHPYYFYDELNWDIPVGHQGDTYDRIFVRLEEIKQSSYLVEQILQKIKPGPIILDDWQISLPDKAQVYGSIEGMMAHFKLIMEGIKPPVGEVYAYTEAANGELGFYLVSDGSVNPYRLKIRPPCFAIYQAYPEMIKGQMIADAVATIGSLNIIAGELDR
ncbi:MAG: NADH dehydrogenase (quinone) subunit D [Pseudomonadota bacterium]